MKAFDLKDVFDSWRQEDRPYHEFIREDSLTVGLYVLPAGGVDRQTPHLEDEVYYITSGRGVINVAGEDRPVQEGSIIFVGKGTEHFFHLIAEELVILVFFAVAFARRSVQ
jgi:mannose-6-phosphate isomerase-like protein (cupin superfamily)